MRIPRSSSVVELCFGGRNIVFHTTAYNLWTFTWFVHFKLPFRLKGTEKMHTERLPVFPSNIYSILFGENIKTMQSFAKTITNNLWNSKLWELCIFLSVLVHPNPPSDFFCFLFCNDSVLFSSNCCPFPCEIFAVVFLVEFSHFFATFCKGVAKNLLFRSKNLLFSTFLFKLRFQIYVVYRVLQSLPGGSLKITLTVPLKKNTSKILWFWK